MFFKICHYRVAGNSEYSLDYWLRGNDKKSIKNQKQKGIMIIILKSNTIETDVKMIVKEVVKGGFKKVTPVYGDGSTVLNCVGKLSEDRKATLKAYLEGLPNVETVMIVDTPLRLSS